MDTTNQSDRTAGDENEVALDRETVEFLKEIGGCLREIRETAFHERVDVFCRRLKVSEVTYRRMESGHTGTSIGAWARAFCMMGVNPKIITDIAAEKVVNRKVAEDVARNSGDIAKHMSQALRRMSDPGNK